MVDINRLIIKRFNNLAGSRYEEILRAYKDFLLSEEEMVVPEISSVLLVVDRYSRGVPEGVYELISTYPSAKVFIAYVVDEATYRLIETTLGEEDARKFREKEALEAREALERIEARLKEMGIDCRGELAFADKIRYVETLLEGYDVLVISKHYGSDSTRTHHISPVVFGIVQHIKKPVVVY